MAVSKDFLRDIIKRHNDQNDTTRIHNLNINNALITLSRVYNPEGLKYPPIDFDEVTSDIIFKEEFTPFTGSDKEIMTTVIGWDVIDMVRYFEPGDEIDAKTGKRVVVVVPEDPVEKEAGSKPEETPVEEP